MTLQTSLFNRLLGLVRLPAARPNDAAAIERQLTRLSSEFNGTVTRLSFSLADGEITVDQFAAAIKTAIKRQHLAVAVVSSGGAHVSTPDTYAVAQRQVDIQMVYFDNWMNELRTTPPTPEQARALANRARMYGSATTTTGSAAVAKAMGVPDLPFHPASRTQCHSYCKCFWNIRPLKGIGNFDCFYEIDELAEHCPTCIARSRAANPLRVRNGVIVNPERYLTPGLYA